MGRRAEGPPEGRKAGKRARCATEGEGVSTEKSPHPTPPPPPQSNSRPPCKSRWIASKKKKCEKGSKRDRLRLVLSPCLNARQQKRELKPSLKSRKAPPPSPPCSPPSPGYIRRLA